MVQLHVDTSSRKDGRMHRVPNQAPLRLRKAPLRLRKLVWYAMHAAIFISKSLSYWRQYASQHEFELCLMGHSAVGVLLQLECTTKHWYAFIAKRMSCKCFFALRGADTAGPV